MPAELLKEIISLPTNDCFTVFSRTKATFNFPLHYHEEFELNFISNASRAKRIIGDHMETIGDLELVLVGPNVPHGWFTSHCKSREIKEVTIQFHRDLFDEKFLQRNQMSFIRSMLERSYCGILFSAQATQAVMPRLLNLTQKRGFDSVLEFMSVLHDLSLSRDMRLLSDAVFSTAENAASYNSRRVERVMDYVRRHFDKDLSLRQAASIASMTDVAFSRFFKNKTGKTFIDTLNEIRLGHASRMLINTSYNITEVAYKCGFNNMSNFNRAFKRKKNCTPKEFRETYNAFGVGTFSRSARPALGPAAGAIVPG